MNICHRLVRLIATLALLLPASAPAQIPQFDSFYVFGDSFVDNGNLFLLTKALGMEPAVPPSEHPNQTYFEGRFSNGYVEFEYLSHRLSGHAPGSGRGLEPFLDSFRHRTEAIDFALRRHGDAILGSNARRRMGTRLKGASSTLSRIASRTTTLE